MQDNNKKLKAALLLLVFSLNTMVGFACSVGFNFTQVFNHHGNKESHSHDQAHQHGITAGPSHGHGEKEDHHGNNKGNSHDHSTFNHHEDNQEENNCCADEVVKFALLDNAIPQTNQNLVPLPVEVLFIWPGFIVADYNNAEGFIKLTPPLLRSWPPASHTELRIVIQSFQI